MNCEFCQYPVSHGQDCCYNCGTPLTRRRSPDFSTTVPDALSALGYAIEAVIIAGLGLGLTYLCFRVSPLVAMFPLFIVLSQTRK